jgi:uridine kinase
VAIDGPDAAGKTTLADELAAEITAKGKEVIRASIDGFHRSRKDRLARGDNPETFYHDSFDHEGLKALLLKPLGPEGNLRFRDSVFDYRLDLPKLAPEQTAKPEDILLFDGIFLMRPELSDGFDYRIFLRVDFEETLRRAMVRDRELFGSAGEARERYERKYIPGQKIYYNEVDPESKADAVIDNNIWEAPRLIFRRKP